MSMKNAGILDGDLVAVHRTSEVRSRQIVVARLENEVTVKRYRQEGPVVWLMPENADFEPIKVDLQAAALLIEGIVVGVVRRGKGCRDCANDAIMSRGNRAAAGASRHMARRLCSAHGCHRHGIRGTRCGFAGEGLAAHGTDRNPHAAPRLRRAFSAHAAARGAHQQGRRALVRMDCSSA